MLKKLKFDIQVRHVSHGREEVPFNSLLPASYHAGTLCTFIKPSALEGHSVVRIGPFGHHVRVRDESIETL